MIKTQVHGNILVVNLETWDADVVPDLRNAWAQLAGDDSLSVGVLNLPTNGGTPSHDLDIEWNGLPLSIDKPVLAAIDGQCYGHYFELALACDLRIAATDARLGLPARNVSYAIAPVMLPRMTFAGLSLEILLAGRTLTAQEAEAARLINKTADPGKVLTAAIEVARSLQERFRAPGLFRKRDLLDLSGLPLTYVMSRVRTV